MTTPGQGPLNDPRLTERRGDLSGLNAALFVILVIVAFLAAAFLLATVLHLGGSASTPSPSLAAASPSISPSSSLPSLSAPPSSGLGSPGPGSSAAVGQPFNVVSGGYLVGTISVVSVATPSTVGGAAPGTGSRWLAVRVRYQAKAALAYDPHNWSIVDSGGAQYPWAGVDAKPALGSGALKAGDKRTGNVTFKVPLTGTLTVLFSGGDAAVSVELPAP